jgi:hypothetical protein
VVCELAQAVLTDRAAALQVTINPYPGAVALPPTLFRPLPADEAAKVRMRVGVAWPADPGHELTRTMAECDCAVPAQGLCPGPQAACAHGGRRRSSSSGSSSSSSNSNSAHNEGAGPSPTITRAGQQDGRKGCVPHRSRQAQRRAGGAYGR